MNRRGRSVSLAVWLLAALVSLGRAEPAPLSDEAAKKLFNARSCNACHALDETRIGPSYRTVALRYRDASPETAGWLAAKIIEGGAGSWGTVPMIANPKLPPEEARAMVRWILALPRSQAKQP